MSLSMRSKPRYSKVTTEPPDLKVKVLVSAIAAATCGFTTANAQQIEEIVVTATRREQTVQEIPYNISVFSAEDLEKAGTNSLSDLTRLVPGLFTIDQGPANRGATNNFVLRGLNARAGSNNRDFPQYAPGTVSTYLGETPVFFPLTIKDIERVEVLRGPQGTLYGSSSTGGTIRFIPNRPDFDQLSIDASSEVSFTDDSDEVNYTFDGVVNVPVIADRLAVRVSAGYEQLGGFIDANGFVATESTASGPDEFPGTPIPRVPGDLNSGFILDPKKNTNDYDNWYSRVSVLWQPTDKIEALFSYHHEESSQDDLQGINAGFRGCDCDNSVVRFPGSFFDNVAGVPGGLFPNGTTTFPGNDGEYEHNRTAPQPIEEKADVASLELNVDIGFATFTSATSYFDTENDYMRVVNGFYEVVTSPGNINLAYLYGYYPRLLGSDRDLTNREGISQEVRLASDWDKRWDFVVGAFYQDTDRSWLLDAELPGLNEWDQAILGGFGANPQLPDKVFVINFDTKFEDIAVFGELTYNITDQWQVTGGIRAFWQDYEADFIQTIPYCGHYCANDGIDPLGTATVGPTSVDFQDELFKLNTSYDINDDMMVYFTWAEGFRRGGANPFPTGGLFASLPEHVIYEPDQVTNYEVGIKGRLGNNVNYSLAGYYIDWEGFQFDENTPSGQFGVFNGSEARTMGVELEARGKITEQLRFNFGYSYTDAEVTKDFVIRDLELFTGVPIDHIPASDGDPLPGVPEHSLAGGLDFQQPLQSNNWVLNWHIDGSYRSDAQSTFNPNVQFGRNFFETDGFSVWNASVTLVADKWTAGLYARNLFSEEGTTGGDTPGLHGDRSTSKYVIRPLTIGLALSYSYN